MRKFAFAILLAALLSAHAVRGSEEAVEAEAEDADSDNVERTHYWRVWLGLPCHAELHAVGLDGVRSEAAMPGAPAATAAALTERT